MVTDDEAKADYKKAITEARLAFERVNNPLLEEYLRRTEPLWKEYLRLKDEARDKYRKIISQCTKGEKP